MRVVALPLTSHRKVDGKRVDPIIYYHFVTSPNDTTKTNNTWMKWSVAKASNAWANLGKAPEGSWKVV